MSESPELETLGSLVAIVTQLLKEKTEAADLVEAFRRGEISREEVVSRLASHYQKGLGATVRELAEHNKEAAQQIGQRLRTRLDSFLAELADSNAALQPGAPDRQRSEIAFRDRDDAVLLREYVIIRSLIQSDESMRSASIFEAVRAEGIDAKDQAITAHLARLLDAHIVGKERKGRYHGIAESRTHLAALRAEIEARGLKVPA